MNRDQIKQDPNNTRIHGQENKLLINKSLSQNGAGRSVVIDNDGFLIAGNGVMEQAEELGMEVEVVESDGSKLIVIKRTDLSYDDEKRLNLAIADNATAEIAEWNYDVLTEEKADEWGIDFIAQEEDVDYSALGKADLDGDVDRLREGVRRGILVEFDLETYEQVNALCHLARENKIDVGGVFHEALKIACDGLEPNESLEASE